MPSKVSSRNSGDAMKQDIQPEIRPPPRRRLQPPASAPAASSTSTHTPSAKRARLSNSAPSSYEETPLKQKEAASRSNEAIAGPSYPTRDEWNDKSVFVRYKSCKLAERRYAVGDFVDVEADTGDLNESWIAQILYVRASDEARVFCSVNWVYSSLKMLADARCRNPPSAHIVQFPGEVVLGQGESLTDIISVQCINDHADLPYLDESNPSQDQIKYDSGAFYRSYLRPIADDDIKNEAKVAVKKKPAKKAKIHDAASPIHVFEHKPTCVRKKHYRPLPVNFGTMIYCPRETCKRWFHLKCLETRPGSKLESAEAHRSIMEFGIELLESDRQKSRRNRLLDSTSPQDTSLSLSNFANLPHDQLGILTALRHAATLSITRGTRVAGIVGNARPILEARDIYQSLLASNEESLPRQTSTAPGEKKGKGRAPTASGDSASFMECWDPETKEKLGVWLRRHGSGFDFVEPDVSQKRESFWACPSCEGPI